MNFVIFYVFNNSVNCLTEDLTEASSKDSSAQRASLCTFFQLPYFQFNKNTHNEFVYTSFIPRNLKCTKQDTKKEIHMKETKFGN